MKKGRGAILIVEDNPHEQLLVKTAFEELGVTDSIHVANDGEEAIAYLKGRGPFQDRQIYRFPTFLLTDLKMPRMNGFELLLFLKRSQMVIIPTIVLTMSSDQDDINKAYQLGANAFHTKPSHMEGLLEMLKRIHEYWNNLQLPDVDEAGNLKPTSNSGKLSEKMRHPVRLDKPAPDDVIRDPDKNS